MKKKLIVIAEDELAYGKILKNELEKKGYLVKVVLNGEELLKALKIEPADLVVLDLVMPVKNGFQTLIEMKKDPALNDIKIIALSNLGQDEDVEKVKKIGVDDYIVKSDEELYTVVDTIARILN